MPRIRSLQPTEGMRESIQAAAKRLRVFGRQRDKSKPMGHAPIGAYGSRDKSMLAALMALGQL